MTSPAARALSAAAEKRRTPETCATTGCDGKPAVTVRSVRLCHDCAEDAGRTAVASARQMNAELPADVRDVMKLKGMMQ